MKSERQQKLILMKISIIVIMIFIFIFWVYTRKSVWKPITLKNSDVQSQNSELSKFKEDVNKQMTEINSRLSEQVSDKKQEEISKSGDQLLKKMIEDVKSSTSSPINTSTVGITSSSSLIKENKNCPEYINCMPTIGEAPSCQIPVGCEGITQIAY